MSEEKENTEIHFVSIHELSNTSFVVKDYQRGYKWQKEHVEALLKDIDNHKKGKYCLQPLVVSEIEDKSELIDGQQRITTLFLLLYFLTDIQYFSIDYQTRDSTQKLLNDEIALLKKSIEKGQSYNDFCDQYSEFDNPDVFYLHEVLSAIKLWFANSTENQKKAFQQKLLHQVYVIWYDVTKHQSETTVEDVFLNLNAGKIPLTSSELIKALFVLSIQSNHSTEIAELKAYELANEWDQIESQLHDDSFWHFMSDKLIYNNLDTRIDLVIDLSNQISENGSKPSKTAYRLYEKKYLNKEKLDWSAIKQTFNKLREWYEDKNLFHYIGFLVNARIKSLSEIVELSKGKTKLSFENELIEAIKVEFSKSKKVDNDDVNIYDFDVLNYKDYKDNCTKLLLLFNIQSYLRDKSSNRFPFDLYKKENWSVEHINPQNPRYLKDVSEVTKWLNTNKRYFENHYQKSEKELIENITSILQVLDSIEKKEVRLSELRMSEEDRKKLDSVVERITESLGIHFIANLTLLDRKTNSKLGNLVFSEKRKKLLELYYEPNGIEEFIPICTKEVFSKSYSKNVSNSDDYIFGHEDMRDYQKHLKNQLKDYLSINE